MDENSYKHWSSNRDEDNIIWLTLDKQNSSANTIDITVLDELLAIIQNLQKGNAPLGLVIQSGKKNGFIAGADIQQFKHLDTPDSAFNLIRHGQIVFNHLAELSFPTVALIQGFCLGGGLELALACRYRVAVDDPKTKLGLPEVMLGIHPGWGGTVRLPRLIGGLKAMDLILSGRSVTAKAAAKMGVVDCAVPLRQSLAAVQYCLKKQPKIQKLSLMDKCVEFSWARVLLGKWLKKKLMKKVNPVHYPAPYVALDHWVEQGTDNDAAFMSEAKSITQLIVGETVQNLIRVFTLRETLKALGKEISFVPNHVHVVGAGVMGGDIAAWCALNGIRVTLQDQSDVAINKALIRAAALFQKQLKEPHLVRAAKDRLIPDLKGFGIKKADLIIEAIVEKVEAKKALFIMLQKEAKKDALFATNTSTIPLKDISDDYTILNRLIGLHFFNPVPRMPLVEVISDTDTDHLMVQKGMSFVRLIDKLPLPVMSSPGFLVNRILMPYLMESVVLIESGVPPYAIDKAAMEFGMPMGPVELADTVGLDVCLYGAESLNHYFGGTVPSSLRKMVEQGHLGKKSGKGFYDYKAGKQMVPKVDENYRLPEDLIDRLILCMVNEAVACLREKVVHNADLLDAGMIFGTGFPPFRGGIMHYVAEQGGSLLLQRLNALAQRHGKRFQADTGWSALNI